MHVGAFDEDFVTGIMFWLSLVGEYLYYSSLLFQTLHLCQDHQKAS